MQNLLMIAGMAGAAALIYLLWSPKPRKFQSEEEVRDAWARSFPDLPAGTVTMTTQHAAALVMTAQGPGLVWPVGSKHPARLLAGAQARATPTGLDLIFADKTAPHLRLVMPPSDVRAWARVIRGGDK